MKTDFINESQAIIEEVFEVLGPGHLETVYQHAFMYELENAGIEYELEKYINVWYKGHKVGFQKIDFLIEGKIVVEMKAGFANSRAGRIQLRSYLRSMGMESGIFIQLNSSNKHKTIAVELINVNEPETETEQKE